MRFTDFVAYAALVLSLVAWYMAMVALQDVRSLH